MALRANLSADFTEFGQALKAVDQQLKGTGDVSAKLGGDLKGLAQHFRDAGGASALTAQQQANLAIVAKDLAAKYDNLGVTVPRSFKGMADAAGEAAQKSQSFFDTLTGGVTAGTLLANALMKVGTIGVDAIKKLGAEIIDLTMQGSKELGIEKAFERLTGQVGMNAKTVLEDLKVATHRTIEEFDLMVRVNENLAAGMNLTEKQYKTLAAGAFALAKATGKDVKDAFDTMSDAMLTGRTRAVALLTGKIDLADAETKYAKSLGVTREELSAEGKIEAARVAIIEKVGASIDRLGEQTDGLGTKVKQAQVWWKDYQDELGKVIASSPVLMTFVNDVGGSLSAAFGVAQEDSVKQLGLAVDGLAISLVGLGANVAPVVGVIGTEFNAIQVLFRNTMQVIDLATLGVKMLALAGLEAADAITPGGAFIAQQQRIRSEMGALVLAIDARKAAIADDKKSEDDWWNLGERLNTQLETLQAKMEASRRTFGEHKVAVDVSGTALATSTDRFIDHSKATKDADVAAASFVKTLLAEAGAAQKLAPDLKLVNGQLTAMGAAQGNALPFAGWADPMGAVAGFDAMIAKAREAQAATAAVRKAFGDLAVTLPTAPGGNLSTPDLGASGEQAAESWGAGFQKIAKGFPNLIVQSFTGSGDWANALGALGAQVGELIGTKLGKSLGTSIGGLLGETLGSLLPGIGAMLGPLLEGITSKLFKTEGRKVNDLRDAFVAAAGGIAELNRKAAAAGTTLDALLRAKTVKDYEAAVASLNKELDRTAKLQGELADLQGTLAKRSVMDWEAAKALIEKYGGTLDGLGPRFSAAMLSSSWQTIWDDWQTLIDMGGDVGGVLVSMKDEIGKLVAESLRIGTEIPAQFRPLIEELIRTGQLFDANGEAITDLSQLKFGAPLVSEVDKLLLKIDDLIKALTERLVPAFADLSRPIAPPWQDWEFPGMPAGGGEGYARGGVAYAAQGWMARGTDTIPAMLTPGERVLSVAQNYDYERGRMGAGPSTINITVPVLMDSREVGRAVVRVLPRELATQGY